MGVSANLIINARHDVGSIKDLLRGLRVKITRENYLEDHAFIGVDLGEELGATLYIARTTSHGGLDATLIMAGSRPAVIDLFERMARVTGGMLQREDTGDEWVEFQDPHQGNARYVFERGLLLNANGDSDVSDEVAKAVGYKR